LAWSCSEQPTQPETDYDPQPAFLTVSNRAAGTCEAADCHPKGFGVGRLSGAPATVVDPPCGPDLLEGDFRSRISVFAADNAATDLSTIADAEVGASALRADTQSGFEFWVRYDGGPIDATERTELRLQIRALNETPFKWQGEWPWITLVDGAGRTSVLKPAVNLLPIDGVTWLPLSIPLAGDDLWTATSDAGFDAAGIVALQIHADTWDTGFRLDIDGLRFVEPGAECTAP
jgi:hypothetical protein